MANTPNPLDLTRRERQIMEVVYREGRGTAAEIRHAISDAPSYSGIRTLLRVLVEKRHLRIERDGARYVYLPRTDAGHAQRSAVRQLLRTFFRGSARRAMLALLDEGGDSIDRATEQRLRALITNASEER